MSQRNSEYPRQTNENYETPGWLGEVAADHYLRGRCEWIWEPCDGPGSQLAKALRKAGFAVVTSFDDFLARRALPNPRVQAICTNPPYGEGGRLAHRIIAHAITLAPIVAMLLRIDYDSGKTRSSLFGNCPHFAGKIILTDRITWFTPAIASPSVNHAWYLWDRNHHGEPTIKYARRPQ